MQVEDVGESKGWIVMMQIQTSVWHESELTSDWSSVAREFEELYSSLRILIKNYPKYFFYLPILCIYQF